MCLKKEKTMCVNYKKISKLWAFGIIFLASIGHASELPSVNESIERLARLAVSQNWTAIIDSLAQSLILKDDNQAARNQLLGLLNRNDLPVSYRWSLLQLEGLYRQRANVMGRLQNQKNIYRSLIEESVTADSQYSNFLSSLDAEVKGWGDDLPSPMQLPEDVKTGSPLEILNYQLSQEITHYENILTLVSKDIDRFSINQKKRVLLKNGRSYSFDVAENSLMNAPDTIQLVRHELNNLYAQMQNLKDEVDSRNQRIDRLSNQLKTLSLDAFQKDRQLTEKFQNVQALRDELAEMESRFRFGQQIIENKNEKIIALEKNLASLDNSLTAFKKAFNQDIQTREKRMMELTGIIEIYQGKLKDAVNFNHIKDDRINLLVKEIKSFKNDGSVDNSLLHQTFNSLNVLQNEVSLIKSQIAQLFEGQSQASVGKHLTKKVQSLERQLETTRAFLEHYSFE